MLDIDVIETVQRKFLKYLAFEKDNLYSSRDTCRNSVLIGFDFILLYKLSNQIDVHCFENILLQF